MFWGYQLVIVLAATSYVFGGSESKEYAEPAWHIDLLLTAVSPHRSTRTMTASTICSPAIPRRRSATSTAAPEITELDAVIAYLQILGTLVDFSTFEIDEDR